MTKYYHKGATFNKSKGDYVYTEIIHPGEITNVNLNSGSLTGIVKVTEVWKCGYNSGLRERTYFKKIYSNVNDKNIYTICNSTE